MNGENEEFQDAMAGCTEIALTTRRALGCLCGSWRRKVRASILGNPELKVCLSDCVYENVRFILDIATPGVHEHVVVRIADHFGEDVMPTIPVRKLLYPELCSAEDWESGPIGNVVVPFEDSKNGKGYELRTHKPGVGYMGPTAAYLIGRFLAYNDDYCISKPWAFNRAYKSFLHNVRSERRFPYFESTTDRDRIGMMEWALLAGAYEIKAANAVKTFVAKHHVHTFLYGDQSDPVLFLDLGHAGIDCDAARRICNMLVAAENAAKCVRVRRLDLTNACTPRSLGVLGHLMRAPSVLLPHLAHIDFSKNPEFGRCDGVDQFVAALKERRMRPIETLLLNGCGLMDKHIAQLASCFSGPLSGLTTLSLARNPLTVASLDCIMETTRDSAPLPVLQALTLPGGQYLSDTTISQREWSGAARFLPTYPHAMPVLRKLRIDRAGWDMSQDGWIRCVDEIEQALSDERRTQARRLACVRQPTKRHKADA